MRLIKRIVNALLPSLPQQGASYTTETYPSQDKAVVWHDGLDILAERSWYETTEEPRNSAIPPWFSSSQADLLMGNRDRLTIMDDALPEKLLAHHLRHSNGAPVSPATGLPILGDFTDAMGNNLTRLDKLSSETPGSSFDFFNSYCKLYNLSSRAVSEPNETKYLND